MQKDYLVIKLARMGDLLQSKRLVLSLEQSGRVWLVVDDSVCELAKLIYPRARVIPIPAHAKGDKPLEILSPTQKAVAELADVDFDLVFNLNFSGINFALSRLFPPEIMRGYYTRSGQQLKSKWTRMTFNLTRSRAAAGINLVDLWALHAPDPISPEQVNPPAVPRGRELAVIVSGRSQRRSIPASILCGYVRALSERYSAASIVFLGGRQDKDKAREIAASLPRKHADITTDLTGATGWPQLLNRLEQAAAVLTPDTGPMHLAAHLGVPVWAFFFSSAWCFETGPYGLGHRILQTTPACAPCLEDRKCRFNLACHGLLAEPGVLRFLLGKSNELPGDILCLQSNLDGLGTYYSPLSGTDPRQEARRQLRSCLLSYHRPEEEPPGPLETQTAGRVFSEREWMLRD
ncbi:MAG: glycosyltransferase family 9 protein [Desulfonatronovibrionaceae bacterium]